jgi:hypothetical protein
MLDVSTASVNELLGIAIRTEVEASKSYSDSSILCFSTLATLWQTSYT